MGVAVNDYRRGLLQLCAPPACAHAQKMNGGVVVKCLLAFCRLKARQDRSNQSATMSVGGRMRFEKCKIESENLGVKAREMQV